MPLAMLRWFVPLALAAAMPGCASSESVSLVRTAGYPVTPTPLSSIPLEVVTRATAVKDPMPVSGAEVSYTDLEIALGTAVSSAAAPWAEKHVAARPGGWQLMVELVQADAQEDDGRFLVTLSVRATLRGREDRSYLGQTQSSCREGAIVPADRATPVVYGCLQRIGRDLSAWLGQSAPI